MHTRILLASLLLLLLSTVIYASEKAADVNLSSPTAIAQAAPVTNADLAAAATHSAPTPDFHHQFLSFITNPNIAYMLMLIAIYGLFFEFTNPGLLLPGISGVISLLLVLYTFQLMPIDYAGLSLILFGITCMIAEVFISSFGIIGIGGMLAFMIGSIMLFNFQHTNHHLSWPLVATTSILTILFFFIILSVAVKSQKAKIVSGKEGLIGSKGKVISIANQKIVAQVLGELWEAKSSHTLNQGDKIKVTHINGLVLTVQPLTEDKLPLSGDKS